MRRASGDASSRAKSARDARTASTGCSVAAATGATAGIDRLVPVAGSAAAAPTPAADKVRPAASSARPNLAMVAETHCTAVMKKQSSEENRGGKRCGQLR